MIYLDNFKFIYGTAKILIKFLTKKGKTNLVVNYLDLMSQEKMLSDIFEDVPLDIRILCAFTASELYDNPNLPEATPLMVVNNMYYFTILDTSPVKNEVECYKCGGDGKGLCYNCGGSGEIVCDDCDGNGDVNCNHCDGNGEDNNGEPCNTCHGGGSLKCNNCSDGYILCNKCNGPGEIDCSECNGTGEINTDDYVRVTSYVYISTDQELLKILKSKSNAKESLIDIFKNKIEYGSKILYMGTTHQQYDIKVYDVKTISNYSDDYFVTGINKIKSLKDIQLKKFLGEYDIQNSVKYFT